MVRFIMENIFYNLFNFSKILISFFIKKGSIEDPSDISNKVTELKNCHFNERLFNSNKRKKGID